MEDEEHIRDELLDKEDEEQIRYELSEAHLEIATETSFMFDYIDFYVAQSRDNTTVKEVMLYPFDFDGDADAGNYEFWDKVGQIVGNLMELQTLTINFFDGHVHGDEVHIPGWEILARILPYLRHKVALCAGTRAEDEEIQGLARAIHGHPMISEFSSQAGFTIANLGPWCSALATLPSLKKVAFGLEEPDTEDQRDLVNLEPLKELLRAPALRFVGFAPFYFTNALCHVVASALEETSSIIDITFSFECTFPGGGRAMIANALKRNATVTHVEFRDDFDESFCNTLAGVLLYNSTLQNLTLQLPSANSGRWLSSIFLSLGMNTTLKSLTVNIRDEFGDELCAAIRSGLAKNSTLETLALGAMFPSDDDGAVAARNALSFLRTNTTLKSLAVIFVRVRQRSYTSAFQLEAVKIIEENPFLESLTIETGNNIKFVELLELISALQRDTTLKTLGFQSVDEYFRYPLFFTDDELFFTDDEVSQLVPILMKNYGLERLVPDIPCADDRTVKAILRLNGAGRRYLIKDGASISKGVEVLSAVSDEIDCVFLHLLENPGLCNRRAAETTTISRRPGTTNLDESSSSGKRERAQSQPGKEPRRRLA
jgi:hypothetical protein